MKDLHFQQLTPQKLYIRIKDFVSEIYLPLYTIVLSTAGILFMYVHAFVDLNTYGCAVNP